LRTLDGFLSVHSEHENSRNCNEFLVLTKYFLPNRSVRVNVTAVSVVTISAEALAGRELYQPHAGDDLVEIA
jgi:hypothetical protein